jgi:hypothetical protein
MTTTRSPYLDVELRQIEERHAEIEALRDRDDLSRSESAHLRSLEREQADAYERAGVLHEQEQHRQAAGLMAARIGPSAGFESLAGGNTHHTTPDAGTGLHPLLPTREGLAALRTAAEDRQDLNLTILPAPQHELLHHRAVVAASQVGGPVRGGFGRLPEPRRISTSVGLMPEQGVAGIRGLSGPRFGQPTSAAPTPEGSTKPEADGVAQLDVPAVALARWTDTSRAALLSDPTLLERIVEWHGRHLARDEDRQLVTALTAAAGAPVDGSEDPAAAVRNALAAVADAASADADLVAVHPNDYATVTGFEPTSGGDVGSWAQRIGPAIVYPTSEVTAGSVLVAAVVAGTVLVQPSPADTMLLHDLKENVVTIRSEIYSGAGVRLLGSARVVTIGGEQ